MLGIAAAPAFASIDITIVSQSRSFSPNGDGQEDTVNVHYCLSDGANLDIVVENTSSTVVKTIESGVSHGAGCDDVAWDGRNTAGALVPDGAYSLLIHASGSAGTGDASYDTAVDTRLPGVLNSPHPADTLSGTASFVFTPTAGFANISSVSVTCIGTANTPAGNGTFTASGDTSTCPEGSNTLNAQVAYSDGFGAGHSWSSPDFSVTISNPVRAETVWYIPARSFSPNADGQEDTVTASFCVTRDATVDVVVKNAANVVVRTIEIDTSVNGVLFSPGFCYGSQATSVTWDGTNDANAVVPNGDYSIEIQATDAEQNTDTAVYETAVDTRVPGTITQPASGAHLSGVAPFVFTPTAGFGALDGVYVDCLGSGTVQGNGTWTGSGDTSACGPNVTSLTASVSYTDQFGSFHSWQSPGRSVTIALQATRPPNDVSQSFSPNADGQEDSVDVPYCLTDDATVTITVHNAAHTLVRTLEQNVAHDAQPCYGPPYEFFDLVATWDGRNTGGTVVPDGAYTVDIHAVAGSDTSDLSIPTTVDTRVPGVISTPASGATLSTTANFVFTPTSGFTGIQSVSVDCIDAVSTSPEVNGTYIGSGSTTGCPPGASDLHAARQLVRRLRELARLDITDRCAGHARQLAAGNRVALLD